MQGMLKSMRMKKNGVPTDVLPIFEEIVQIFQNDECDAKFMKAMEEYLTEEQRFRLYEQNGSCNGTKDDAKRKAFAAEHADLPLAERFEMFVKTFKRKAILNDDNTITVTFKCRHGYYLHAPKGQFKFVESIETYFGRCAGGRMYELQKALGIKLRIKSVDVSPLSEDIENPVVFIFEIVQ